MVFDYTYYLYQGKAGKSFFRVSNRPGAKRVLKLTVETTPKLGRPYMRGAYYIGIDSFMYNFWRFCKKCEREDYLHALNDLFNEFCEEKEGSTKEPTEDINHGKEANKYTNI